MGNHVFICYAREDERFTRTLAQGLKARNVYVWMDRLNLRPGEDWDRAIDKALYDCAQFLIVLSPDAVESREVRGELRTALDENKPIVPVICHACQIPRQLRTIQYIDFSSSGAVEEEALAQLLDVLRDEQHANSASESKSGDNGRTPQDQTPISAKRTGEVFNQEIVTPPRLITNGIGIELILISPGEFLMGSEDGSDREKPVRRVQISQPFYMGKYPVTQAQWQAVMGNNPNHFTGDPNRPVEQVSWNDAQEFLRKLSEREKGKPYRLPTEAEWEYAARAGTTTAYCFGDDPERLHEYAWYDKNSDKTTHPVGQLKPNAWGLHDVHGNVWEWMQDWFANNYYRQRSNLDRDPKGPDSGEYRVLRGGSWYNEAEDVRVARRHRFGPGLRRTNFGVRCAQ